jgi:hypothetical protein
LTQGRRGIIIWVSDLERLREMDEVSYQRFLSTRICDLGLDVNESMAPYFRKLRRELKDRRILLWPDFYFGNEWGCVDKKIAISIPFYLATPELRELEGAVPRREGIMKILRHETGHAVNYAYRLWQREKWRENFGDFRKRYPKTYLGRVNPWSRSFVRHLHYVSDRHYAQKHPDEDWAETFATWLDPRSHWRVKYRRWPQALEKLAFVDFLMDELVDEEPSNTIAKHDGEYTEIEETVAEWWGIDGEILDEELQEYMKDMSDLFIKPTKGRRKCLPAWKLIRKYARVLTDEVGLWISRSNRHTVRRCLRLWEAICRNESLGYRPEEEDRMLIELTILLTYHVMDGVQGL